MLDPDSIRRTLAKLGNRDWPDTWGPREHKTIGDFEGWTHQYQLNERLSPETLHAFEELHSVILPDCYRMFLCELGNGGAGPHYGIYALGTDEHGPLRGAILENLKSCFVYEEDWDGPFDEELDFSDDLMQGAMPIATRGCAMTYWMVVTGPQKGQIWFDDRAHGNRIEPVENEGGNRLTFDAWYMNWLIRADKTWGHSRKLQ